MIDCLIIDFAVFRVTTVFQVHWARWERTGNVDSEGMLDPPVLQELKGSRSVDFYFLFIYNPLSRGSLGLR